MNLEFKIKRMPAVQFTFDLWRAGSLNELGITHREWAIKDHIHYIRSMAIGYTEGSKLSVRRKPDYIAIMFFTNNSHFWTHLTIKECLLCFPHLLTELRNIKP